MDNKTGQNKTSKRTKAIAENVLKMSMEDPVIEHYYATVTEGITGDKEEEKEPENVEQRIKEKVEEIRRADLEPITARQFWKDARNFYEVGLFNEVMRQKGVYARAIQSLGKSTADYYYQDLEAGLSEDTKCIDLPLPGDLPWWIFQSPQHQDRLPTLTYLSCKTREELEELQAKDRQRN